jgi:multiple sugar transport system ATP-binding protein
MNLVRGKLTKNKGDLTFREASAGDQNSGFEFVLSNEAANRLSTFAEKEIIIGIRAEHISMGNVGQNRPAIELTVENVEHLGTESWIYGTTGTHKLVARLSVNQVPQLGLKVQCHLDDSKLHFFDPQSGNAI